MTNQTTPNPESNVAQLNKRASNPAKANVIFPENGNTCLEAQVQSDSFTVIESIANTTTKVNLQFLSGQIIFGRIVKIDYATSEYVFHEVNHNRNSRVAFDKIRLINFPEPMMHDQHAYTAQRGFRIVYHDGEQLTGMAKAIKEEKDGVHIWQQKTGSGLTQVFIPTAVISEKYLNNAIGETLVKDKKLNDKQLQTALDYQKNLRKRKIGDYLQKASVISAAELKTALTRQSGKPISKIGEILIAEGMLSQEQLEEALERQKNDRQKRLGQILVDLGYTDTTVVHAVLAQNFGLPYVKLENFNFEKSAIDLVPSEIAKKFCLVPLMKNKHRLVLAMEDPTNMDAITTLKFLTNSSIEIALASREEIELAINRIYLPTDGIEGIDEDLIIETGVETQPKDKHMLMEEARRLGEDKPIVKLVNNILVDAVARNASDVHIQPKKHSVDIVYRVDGSLVKINRVNKQMLSAIASRIKIIGKMNIAERRLPQDGGARLYIQDKEVDIRISIIPTIDGESIVIRILNAASNAKPLEELGFSEHDLSHLKEILSKSAGMLLVTGPTGSGKSTTLYSALHEIMKREISIVTVEDPVENHIDGIEQIQVQPSIEFTFARALRHILRHDPDAIMIGEMRDGETAKIAVESAMTGHLVLSTLHTNDAASTITRLVEMGIEPYMVASTLSGILAQRLIRLNCAHCAEKEDIDADIRKTLGINDKEEFYKGKGCNHCNHTGYKGRMPVYELLPVNADLRNAISANMNTDELTKRALKSGMVPLTENALEHARQGKTSLAEVYRVRLQ